MLIGFLLLVLFNLMGYALVTLLHLPIPASVAGLILLLVYLMVRGSLSESLAKAAIRLLPLLPLFLLPASVGVVEHSELVRQEWLPILLALTLSLVASFLATPILFRFFVRLCGKS